MRYLKHHKVFFLLTLLVLSSCSASRLLSTWQSKNIEQFTTESILIIGIAKDETKRRIYEDTFSDSFQATGVKAVPSYTVSKQPISPKENILRDIVAKSGCDSVLITHIVGATEKEFYQRHTMIVGTNSVSNYGLYGYYPFIYNSVYSGGSYVSTTRVILETSLYDVQTEQRIWSARSESIDPVMTKKYYQELIDLFISDLQRNQIVTPNKSSVR